MRSQRTRRAVRQANEYVDLDSDEFEQALADEDSPPQRKRQKKSSSCQPEPKPSLPAATHSHDQNDEQQNYDAQNHRADEQDNTAIDLLEESADSPSALQEGLDADDDYVSSSNSSVPADSAVAAADGDDEEYNSSEHQSSKQQHRSNSTQKPKAKQKKPRKKRQSTARLCASYAKAQFGLTDTDLKALTDIEYRDNPHYAGGYPMKLYLVRELEELAQRKRERKAAAADTKEERAEQRAMEARARKAAAAAKAAETTKQFDAPAKSAGGRHGSLALPDTCLAAIMTCLGSSSLEPGGLRGPSQGAKQLAQAALVCWDFYHAVTAAGFPALAAATDNLQQLPPPAYISSKLYSGLATLPGPSSSSSSSSGSSAACGWEFWDAVVQRPMELKLPQLKDAARQLGLGVTGTKAELVLRLLNAFGLSAPASAAPAQLLRALLLERNTSYAAWDGPDAETLVTDVHYIQHKLRVGGHPAAAELGVVRQSVAAMRNAFLAAGFNTMAEMKATADALHAEWQRKEREAAAQRAEEGRRHREEQARRAAEAYQAHLQRVQQQGLSLPPMSQGNLCMCGNVAALACTRRCCGACCRVMAGAPGAPRCPRHKT